MMTDAEYAIKLEEANKIALDKERKETLNTIIHKNDKPKSMSFTKKIMMFLIANCVVVEIYSMCAMFYFQDLTALYALIGSIAGECVLTCGYFVKSKSENTAGGIVFESAMAKLKESKPENDEDAVG